ncbi:hypothetical protein I1300191J6_05470 [Parabacteroides distasonis]|nr:hypothetical protein DN0286_04770 [Parabacteroides distasonis]GKH85895.1 hypothetical protein CE91St4_20950 [Parabacteroides distasonis]GKH89748.1 hypothetical protein CE91St5_20930 [Parabacteroides distasonis]
MAIPDPFATGTIVERNLGTESGLVRVFPRISDYIYEGRPYLYEKGGPTYLGGESHLNMNYLKFL